MSTPNELSPTQSEHPRLDVLVVAWGPEEWLGECLDSALASHGVSVRVWVVDNGSTSQLLDPAARSALDPRIQIITPGRNLGFAAACSLAAERAHATDPAPWLALLNSDARLEPDALCALVAAATPDVGIVTAQVVLADRPELINSAGNPVHYLGLSWAGGFEEPASAHATPREVASASGAAMLVRRSLWEELGGFDPEFFMYCEDTDLSLRARARGSRVLYVPAARAHHHYEFSRNPEKFYHLERNRLIVLLSFFERRTLLLMLPALLVLELAVCAGALLGGWFPQKIRGWGWLLTHRRWIKDRRARVRAGRTVPDAEILAVLEARITSAALPAGPALTVLNALLGAWFRILRAL